MKKQVLSLCSSSDSAKPLRAHATASTKSPSQSNSHLDLQIKIKINELFYSIQGESTYAGLPTFFIRTSGCPLRCTYCDTTYAYYQGTFQTLASLLEKAKAYPTPYVCVTGGEPLIQKGVFPLLTQLCDAEKKVSLETSGAYSCDKVDSRVKIILDVKTPDSGEGDSFLKENLLFSKVNTEFKFVLCSKKDFYWAEDFVRKNKIAGKFTILYSPCFEKMNLQWLAKKMLEKSSPARFHLQLHKAIWDPEKKGV